MVEIDFFPWSNWRKVEKNGKEKTVIWFTIFTLFVLALTYLSFVTNFVEFFSIFSFKLRLTFTLWPDVGQLFSISDLIASVFFIKETCKTFNSISVYFFFFSFREHIECNNGGSSKVYDSFPCAMNGSTHFKFACIPVDEKNMVDSRVSQNVAISMKTESVSLSLLRSVRKVCICKYN